MARDLAVDSLASVWVPLALFGALAWPTRLRAVLVPAGVVLLGLWLAVGFTPLTARVARGLVRRDAVAPGDAVLVLASRVQKDGDPTAAASSRLLHALELLRQDQAPRLMVTEVAPPAPSSRALAQRMMAGLGIVRDVVAVGPVATTRDEAVRAAALCRERGWRRLLVVTSPTHSRRACGAVEREGVGVVCSPSVETEFDVETFDRPVERFAGFRAALHEWAGIWWYERRGWLN